MTKMIATTAALFLAITGAASAGEEPVTDSGAKVLAMMLVPWPADNATSREDLRIIAQKSLVIGYVIGIKDATEGLCPPDGGEGVVVSAVQTYLERQTREQLRMWSYYLIKEALVSSFPCPKR